MGKAIMVAVLCLAELAVSSGEDKNAKPPNAKPDQCWTMTQSGNRCKRRAQQGFRYCTQHSSSVKPAKPVERCRSMTEDGKQCESKPVKGQRYCEKHMPPHTR